MKSVREEIDDVFSDYGVKLDEKLLYDEKINSFQSLLAYQAGMTEIVSPAWNIFKCRAKKRDRYEILIAVCQMLMCGEYSLRQIREKTGWSFNTILRLSHKLRDLRKTMGMGTVCCPCGKPLHLHRGWCKFRVSKSLKRQQFLKTWQSPKMK